MDTAYMELAQRVADQFAGLTQVNAVALGGSFVGRGDGKHTDAASDIDLYVYTSIDIPLEIRTEIVERVGGSRRASLGLNFWGPGDEWFDADTGIEVDMIYFDAQWMEGQIRRVVLDYQPSLGYSTCLWYTLHHSHIFYDSNGWLTALGEIYQRPYPEPLRRNIIAYNHPVLREIIPAYFYQIEKALDRNDLVSVNHRLAGLLASYFDIIFALNHELHPGEKRLVSKALAVCKLLPDDMEADIRSVLGLSARADPALLTHLTRMLNRLDRLLAKQGFHYSLDTKHKR